MHNDTVLILRAVSLMLYNLEMSNNNKDKQA